LTVRRNIKIYVQIITKVGVLGRLNSVAYAIDDLIKVDSCGTLDFNT